MPRIQRVDMFATPDTKEDLINWCNLHNGNERIVALTAAGMAMNLIAKLQDEEEAEIELANMEIQEARNQQLDAFDYWNHKES